MLKHIQMDLFGSPIPASSNNSNKTKLKLGRNAFKLNVEPYHQLSFVKRLLYARINL